MNSGKMVLGVFRGGIFFFQEDGELTFHHAARGFTAGFLFDVEGKGSASGFVKTERTIAVYDFLGAILYRVPIQGIVYEMRIGRLDSSDGFVLMTSEDERVPVPVGAKATEWAKRTVRCYNAQSLGKKWEYRIGPMTRIGAVEDVDGDGYNEIICGTYASENGVSWEDMDDTGHGYVFALDRFGKRLWKQTFAATYASICPSVADLDGDGKPEVVVACGSWLRNWGGVCVLNAKDGSLMCRFPTDGELDYSVTAAGVADLNGDGRQEIICSSTGHHGGFFVLDSQCKPTGYEHKISPLSMDYDFVVCRLGAINDIDGDGKLEVIGTTSIEKIIAKDPRFTYSKFSDPTLLVLSSTLLLKTNLALDEPCSEMAVSDLIAGGANEIITLTDNISVYSVKEGKR